jgi:hypothetical protein
MPPLIRAESCAARQADLSGHIPATSGSAGLGLRNFVSDRAQAGPRTVLKSGLVPPLKHDIFPCLVESANEVILSGTLLALIK